MKTCRKKSDTWKVHMARVEKIKGNHQLLGCVIAEYITIISHHNREDEFLRTLNTKNTIQYIMLLQVIIAHIFIKH